MPQGYGVSIASDADFLTLPTLQPLGQAFHRRHVLIESCAVEEIRRDNDPFHQCPNKQRLLFLQHRNLDE